MWRANPARTASTDERLPAQLTLHWSLQLPTPRPAWPAEQGKVRFDASYEPVVAGGRLFVPSMVHDCVTAYALADGQPLWTFFADAPVRFAPLVHGQRLLFVSDDGYLYCVSADKGELFWKYRGGPTDRWVLGNDRLVSTWPARGAPVSYGDTVYFAAGIWPFMGVFVHAVDIASGQAIWTNSGSGSNYIVQQHGSPAFAGVTPQGYLAVNEQVVLVSGGMTVPAAFDRETGRFLYFRPGDRTLGKDQGGYEVVMGDTWFANRGRRHRLSDGVPLLESPADIFTADCTIGVTGKNLVGLSNKIVRDVETTLDSKGKEKKTVKYRVAELWRVPLPENVTRLHVKAGQQLIAGDGGSSIYVFDRPGPTDNTCRLQWEGQISGTVWRMLVSDKRLFVVSEEGGIYCFGESNERPQGVSQVEPETLASDNQQIAATPNSQDVVRRLLDLLPDRDGYAIVQTAADISLLIELAQQTRFHILAMQPSAELRTRWRAELRQADLLGTRVAIVPGTLTETQLPPYVANLIVADQLGVSSANAAEQLQKIFSVLRPYGGTACLSVTADEREWLQQAHAAAVTSRDSQPDFTSPHVLWQSTLQPTPEGLVLRRPGPLAGAGVWTAQNGDPGNTQVSQDHLVKAPLGLLWFGGPSNKEVLPRHGHGPTPQVIGGRLFIEGRDMLRAVDVYTGRLLWQRAFENVGLFFDNTRHHPGANAIGGNFVTTQDSVYLFWGKRCVRLDPRSGATLAEFQLPKEPTTQDDPYWGYVSVSGDYLVAGSTPMLLLALGPGETAPEDETKRDIPLYSQFGEGSRQLVVMNRFTGDVLWTREARFNFRHNAIALGDGTLFCLDRMTEQRLAFFRRRGDVPVTDFCLYALDLRTGETMWESTEHAFGTWLTYNSRTKLLLQAGSKNRDRAEDEVGEGMSLHEGPTGRLLWRTDAAYAGPPIFYHDTIVTQGAAYDLGTGEPRQRQHPLTGESLPWQFARNYGCNTAIGCVNLLTFRSAAAGYFDLAHDGGTGNLGGFRSSCTSNLIAADGLLNAPDYTRTCTCSYQNQCSLALIHMPDVEMWTFNPIASSGQRVQRMGINFGAPGDRRAADGTLWLDFPSVGGPSPDVPIIVRGIAAGAETTDDTPQYVRRHMSVVETREPRWVFASGVRDARELRIRLASHEDAGSTDVRYRVRFYLLAHPHAAVDQGELNLKLQGKVRDRWNLADMSEQLERGLVREYSDVLVREFLDIEFTGADQAEPPSGLPLLCGIELTLLP